MARRLKEKERQISINRTRRNLKQKNVILIGLEGTNQTENLYFSNYNKREKPYIIKIAQGNFTDPVNMVEAVSRSIKKYSLNLEEGDKAYCIFDADNNPNKDIQIKKAEAIAKQKGIEIIVSNPCFENWFLCHFRYLSKIQDNKEAIKELSKYIKGYKKNKDIFKEIEHLTKAAIKNAKKQELYHKKQNRDLNSAEANPSSGIYKIVEELIKIQ